ncbi:hypothetical protein [Neorhodopirellula pilleata]|uniref:Uncharacterized protein n=1 Tax=Neorhodopirellula pilleata TaxID=2714738 RepID=A0A5C6AKN5_9BACT|nr:hypothetical protein [Neorhodopirellula pilleata]TWT98743.1 hypothetical protein Pla100_19090 [Neorhodopirellula pilleata]
MVMPIPTWLEYVVIGVTGLGFATFLILLGFLMNWAWEKFFKYLGRNETPNHNKDLDEPM